MKIISAKQFTRQRQIDYGTEEQNEAVKQIIAAVIEEQDDAVIRYTEQFDGVKVTQLRVMPEEIAAAYSQVDEAFITALRQAIHNIRQFHERQKRQSWMDLQDDGSLLGQIIHPLERVGVYAPGGTAAYPSSVLMNVIPAQVAGVTNIAMVTPAAVRGQSAIDPGILVAANELGITEIYRAGGAQAIAALAYGTQTIPAVDKICGPGNIYVALAKRYVFGVVDIDSIAGPTDIAILADGQADPDYVAADLLSQAEHDVLATAILITDSDELASAVQKAIQEQLATLPRRAIAEEALDKQGAIIVVGSMDEGADLVNELAPEHLEILTTQPLDYLGKIRHAGAIFLGEYSSEPVGDYYAGPNHILPTNGTARFSSPLNVDDFIKKSSVIYYSKEALLTNGNHIMTLARAEGFEAHARAIEIRLKKEGEV